jgi:hypothetical protein
MGGQNISVGSTGTGFLLTMPRICMDERLPMIVIDEPDAQRVLTAAAGIAGQPEVGTSALQ